MIFQRELDRTTGTNLSIRRQKGLAIEKSLYKWGRFVVNLYAHTFLDVDVSMYQPLPEGPKIIAVNHPTTTDPFLILTLLSEQMSVLVTKGAFDIPVFGAYLQRVGHVPVLRESGGATVKAAIRLINTGRTVVIFPEGSLSPIERSIGFHEPHSGVARIALSTCAPVIPVGIGLQPECIRFVETKIDGKTEYGRVYFRGPYNMTVGEPLWFQGNVEDREYVRSVSKRIMQHIKNLSRESVRRFEALQEIKSQIQKGSIKYPIAAG